MPVLPPRLVPTDYVIIKAADPDNLAAEVRAMLSGGAELHGPPLVGFDRDGEPAYWAQAIILRELKTDE